MIVNVQKFMLMLTETFVPEGLKCADHHVITFENFTANAYPYMHVVLLIALFCNLHYIIEVTLQRLTCLLQLTLRPKNRQQTHSHPELAVGLHGNKFRDRYQIRSILKSEDTNIISCLPDVRDIRCGYRYRSTTKIERRGGWLE